MFCRSVAIRALSLWIQFCWVRIHIAGCDLVRSSFSFVWCVTWVSGVWSSLLPLTVRFGVLRLFFSLSMLWSIS